MTGELYSVITNKKAQPSIISYFLDSVTSASDLAHTADGHGRTALHYARTDQTVQWLLEASDDPLTYIRTVDEDGQTALHHARTSGILDLLINTATDKLAYISITDNDGHTALMYMAERGTPVMLSCFLEYIEDEFSEEVLKHALLQTNNKSQTIFHLAAKSPFVERFFNILPDYIDLVKLENVLVPDMFNNTPLTYLTARFFTQSFAEFLLRIPMWDRKKYLQQRNRRNTSCLSILQNGKFLENEYNELVLCNPPTEFVHSEIFDNDFYSDEYTGEEFDKLDQMFFPEEYFRCQEDILRVYTYAVGEYSPLDLQLSHHNYIIAVHKALSAKQHIEKVRLSPVL